MLREQMQKHLTMRGVSESTKKGYLKNVERFAKHFGLSPDKMGKEEVQAYLLYLIEEKKHAPNTVNCCHSAMKYLYEEVLERLDVMDKIPHVKRPKKLPTVLDKDEVRDLFSVIRNIKYLAIFMLIYSSGLRVGEACNLLVSDIDSKNMLLRVRQGKGNKDRYTILSKVALIELRKYWEAYRPRTFLFTGRNKTKPIPIRTVQKTLTQLIKRTAIKKSVSVHTLRHSFATHLLDQGANLAHIQKLLGHQSISSTTIYLHISHKMLTKVGSPLDQV